MILLLFSTIIAFHSSWMERQFKTLTKYDENDDENSKDRLLAARLGFILAFEVNCMKNHLTTAAVLTPSIFSKYS